MGYFIISVVGPVSYNKAAEKDKFSQALGKLQARGGIDCAEPVYTAMINALKIEPKFGSSMYIFTDSTAKDATVRNLAAFKYLASTSSLNINFMISADNHCGKFHNIYKDITASTSGMFSIMNKIFL